MNANAYELLSLCMRYVFAVLMVLIILRAWRITLVDGRRAAKLRRLSPETGIVGEFQVISGHDRTKEGMRYPVTLEGTIGSARENDIRLRSRSVRRRHAVFQMTDDGLYIRSHAHGRLRDGFGRPSGELILHDGDFITIGSVRMILILSGADTPPEELIEHRRHRRTPESVPIHRHDRVYEAPPVAPGISRTGDDLFDVGGEIPQPRHSSVIPENIYQHHTPPIEEDEYDLSSDDDDYDDVFYDFDEYDDC